VESSKGGLTMITNILMFFIGTIFGIFIIALLNGNKHDEMEQEKKDCYKQGFEDGCKQSQKK
jgi:hypothetical protein